MIHKHQILYGYHVMRHRTDLSWIGKGLKGVKRGGG